MNTKLIKGLNIFPGVGEDENTYFCNKKMIQDGILIRADFIPGDDEQEYSAVVVSVLKENEASEYVINDSSYLTPIQIHLIIKELYELYTDNGKEDFLAMLEDVLCVSHISTKMQSDPDVKHTLFVSIGQYFVRADKQLSV